MRVGFVIAALSLTGCELLSQKAPIVSMPSLLQEMINDDCDHAEVIYSNLLTQERYYFLETGEACYVDA
jgi:hypothetical protein